MGLTGLNNTLIRAIPLYSGKTLYVNSGIRNISFQSNDTINLSDKSEKVSPKNQTEIMQMLAEFIGDPENRDQRKIKEYIEANTDRKFIPVLDSRSTIKELLRHNFNQQDIDKETEKILNKTFDDKVSLSFSLPEYFVTVKEKVRLIQEQNSLELKQAKDRYNAATREYNSPDDDVYEKAVEAAKANLDKLKQQIKLDAYEELSGLNCKVGAIYEDIAAKEVDRIIIPEVANKIALEEIKVGKGKSVSPQQIKQKTNDIKKQLIQLRTVRLGGSIEIDHLVIRIKTAPETYKGKKFYKNIEVVGVVETKSDINRIAHGYKKRLEDMAWATDYEEGYDHNKYPKKFVEHLHFDEKLDSYFYFSPQSFDKIRFKKKAKEAFENIYLVTNNRPLITLNDEVVKRLIESNSVDDLKNELIPNNLSPAARAVFKKYYNYGLWNNIIFLNDDYCGCSLTNLLIYNKFKNILEKTDISLLHYANLNSKLINDLKNYNDKVRFEGINRGPAQKLNVLC